MPVENILKFGSNLEILFAFFAHAEIATKIEIFRRLPLPAIVVVIGSSRGILSGGCVRPSRLVQYKRARRVHGFADIVWICDEVTALVAVREIVVGRSAAKEPAAKI